MPFLSGVVHGRHFARMGLRELGVDLDGVIILLTS
jgi:hypothetical protein